MSVKNRKSLNGNGHTNGTNGHDKEPSQQISPPPSSTKKPPKVSRKKKDKPFNYSFYVYSALAAVAIIIGSFYFQPNDWTDVQKFIHDFVCRAPGGYCHGSLVPTGRTHVAVRTIRKNQVVLEVPRSLQVWDLDALRDSFVRKELFEARHEYTENPLESGAFLAAYLALRNHTDTSNDPLRRYFDVLPTYQDLVEFHPALWTPDDLLVLEPRSYSFNLAKAFQDMIASEYKAFTTVSDKFGTQISEKDYKTWRVLVLSRSFGAGPPGDEETLDDGSMSLQDELELYKAKVGVDLTLGLHAMVPLLDMYNHHANPNVEWKYDNEKRAFVVKAAGGGILPGHEVMDSYGKYSDSHLFAKFGFVNGDGSGLTQASIAALHKPQNLGMDQFSYLPRSRPVDEALKDTMRQVMVRYLQFDDGYEECIEADKHPEAYELKRLKLEHLVRLANTPERWIYRLPPRNADSKPAKTTTRAITRKPPRFKRLADGFNGRKIISTCRLMTLHHEDFNGTAMDQLKEGLQNETDLIFVGPDTTGDALEYRALMCLVRLTGLKLMNYNTDEEKETTKVLALNVKSFQNRNWTLAHVRLGEIQSLDLVRQISIQGARGKGDRIKDILNDTSDDVLPTFRTKPCPMEYSSSLLDK